MRRSGRLIDTGGKQWGGEKKRRGVNAHQGLLDWFRMDLCRPNSFRHPFFIGDHPGTEVGPRPGATHGTIARMGFGGVRRVGVIAAAVLCLTGRVSASGGPTKKSAPPAPAQPPAAIAVADDAEASRGLARQHFEAAKQLHAAGRYREAAEKLELAIKCDPSGKDLVYNLALVRERLAEPNEALVHIDRYLTMNLEPAERQKAESFRRRLEGSREEIAEKRRKVVVVPIAVESERAVDEWVWLPLAGAGVAAAAGAVLGALALGTRPSGFVTGRDGTYDDLAARTSEAHSYAVFADVSWAVTALGLGLASGFYFGRDAVPVAMRAGGQEQ